MLAMVVISTGSFAQDKKAAGKGEAAKKEAAKDAPKTKKDGTPDMRYKDNKAKKEEPAPAGPTKKDGTPDKRYKANKEGAAKDAAPAKK
ncbi:hypothetical protein GCM10023093_19940 [Nemorincola caseinilytica]|uniref:Uncharacterized protein n=1 Tax=Nemorincola caseinilytica TaxID=2054315 RepID=A0ABP8NF46_9BACT